MSHKQNDIYYENIMETCEHLDTTMNLSPYYVECNICHQQWSESEWTEYKEQKAIQDNMLEAQATRN